MGSPNGIWTAVSGAVAQSQALDTVANNLANSNTVGFKKDTTLFKEYLAAIERPQEPLVDIPRTKFKDSEFYPTDGVENAMVNVSGVTTNHSQGNFKVTNAPFDLAIHGSGFFTVQTPNGLRFTRAGDFKVNADGKLVTTDGYPVLKYSTQTEQEILQQNQLAAQTNNAQSDNGREPAFVNPFSEKKFIAVDANNQNNQNQNPLEEINLKDALLSGEKIMISQDGVIYSGNQKIGKLAIAEFVDPKLLKKEASTLFSNPNPENVAKVATNSNVKQGFLEMSNVNVVSEMLDLIKANRNFESNVRAIKTYSEMSAKEANEVGKL